MVVRVVKVTLAVEAAAILLLFVMFVARRADDQTVGGCAWSALYHSVSAFCNAGFGLHSDSLGRYRDAWDVNLVIVSLIIIGGIGFPVLRDLTRFFRLPKAGKRKALSLHSKIVLITTALLLVLGRSPSSPPSGATTTASRLSRSTGDSSRRSSSRRPRGRRASAR